MLYLTGALVIVSASFWITTKVLDYWSPPKSPTLTHPNTASRPSVAADNRTVVERLAGQRVSSPSELANVEQNTGLRFSPRLKGYVDVVKRVNEREVTIVGWVANPEGDATPLNAVLYAGGVVAGTTQTKGERPDMTHALGLSFGAEKNVRFSISSNCKPDDQLAVVGITATQQYTILESSKCP